MNCLHYDSYSKSYTFFCSKDKAKEVLKPPLAHTLLGTGAIKPESVFMLHYVWCHRISYLKYKRILQLLQVLKVVNEGCISSTVQDDKAISSESSYFLFLKQKSESSPLMWQATVEKSSPAHKRMEFPHLSVRGRMKENGEFCLLPTSNMRKESKPFLLNTKENSFMWAHSGWCVCVGGEGEVVAFVWKGLSYGYVLSTYV